MRVVVVLAVLQLSDVAARVLSSLEQMWAVWDADLVEFRTGPAGIATQIEKTRLSANNLAILAAAFWSVEVSYDWWKQW